MAIKARVLASGNSAQSATNIVGDAELAASATGNAIGDAYQISAIVTNFTTVASSTGAIVPADMTPGDQIYVYNAGAQTLSIYPRSGESINNGSASAAYSLAANKGCCIFKRSATAYGAILTA